MSEAARGEMAFMGLQMFGVRHRMRLPLGYLASDNACSGNLTRLDCAALSGLKADGPGRQRDPLLLILSKDYKKQTLIDDANRFP